MSRPPTPRASALAIKREVGDALRAEGYFVAEGLHQNLQPDIILFQDPEMKRPVEVVCVKTISLVPFGEAYETDEGGKVVHSRASSRTVTMRDIYYEAETALRLGVPCQLIVVNRATGAMAQWRIEPREFQSLPLTAEAFGETAHRTFTPLSGMGTEHDGQGQEGQRTAEQRKEVQPNKQTDEALGQLSNSETEKTTDNTADSKLDKRSYGLTARRVYGQSNR